MVIQMILTGNQPWRKESRVSSLERISTGYDCQKGVCHGLSGCNDICSCSAIGLDLNETRPLVHQDGPEEEG